MKNDNSIRKIERTRNLALLISRQLRNVRLNAMKLEKLNHDLYDTTQDILNTESKFWNSIVQKNII